MTIATSDDARHVEYVLLAEFDIDKGANLKHQYPEKTGTDEHILSELMLPDGAHLRAEDWTIFCLNQLTPDINDATDKDNQLQKKVEKADNVAEKPLLYVLNLVRTKHDATARRGARVKALAICTRHQYLHIYKPVLLLAMEKYFGNPSIEILESLYKAVNSMDLTQMPILTWHERQILRATDNRTMFEELFLPDKPNDNSNSSDIPISTSNNTLTDSIASDQDTNIENSNGHTEESRVRRGTYIDLASGHVREKIPALSKDTHFFETKIIYDGIHLPIKVPLTMNAEEVGDFSVIKLIHTFAPNLNGSQMLGNSSDNKHAYLGSPNPHHPHLDSSGSYTHPIMILLNALLTQKRIVFLGYGHPSGEVANYVLAACALGSGCGTVLKGFTERAFPYTNLTSIDEVLKCPGFIAGVTNPTYEEHTGWWDVLCNISTGKITVSDRIESIAASTMPATTAAAGSDDKSATPHSPPSNAFHSLSIGRTSSLPTAITANTPVHPVSSPPSSASPGFLDAKSTAAMAHAVDPTDMDFINDVLVSIQAHYGETSIRAKFQDYVLRFVRLAAAYEEQVYGHTNIGSVLWSTTDDHANHGDQANTNSNSNTATKQRFSSASASSSSTTNTTATTTTAMGLGYGPVFYDEASKQRELNANRHRIEGWRQTISYQYYQRDIKAWIRKNSCIQGLDVYRQISKLKKLKSIPDSEMHAIYDAFLNKVITHKQIIEFLSFLPQHQGGLSPLGVGLFHSNPEIRKQAIHLFRRLEQHPVGIKFIQDLSRFQRIAYERQASALYGGDNSDHMENSSLSQSHTTATIVEEGALS